MSGGKRRIVGFISQRGAAGLLALGMLLGTGLTGCSIVRAVRNASSNKDAITAFTNSLKSGKASPFEATYVTTGGSPTTVIYAARPPTDVAFKQSAGSSANGGYSVDLISNATGEYSCANAGAGGGSSGWTCNKLGNANAQAQNQIVNLYTASHWITFLTAFSVAAGLAGDKVTKSTMTIHGVSLDCISLRAKGVQGTSTICSTAQGILGYVKVAGSPVSFEIKHYTTSPRASLFRLPRGARVVRTGSAG